MPPLLARAAHAGDRKNFMRVETTRLPTSAVYAWFNREQDRYINQKVRSRIEEKLRARGDLAEGAHVEFVTGSGADPDAYHTRTDLEVQATTFGSKLGRAYDTFGKVWGGLTEKAGISGIAAGDDEYDETTYTVRYTRPDGRVVVEPFRETVTTGEKYGRTATGFMSGALMNNFQRSVLKVVDMGDSAPWMNQDGSISANTLTRWVGQEVFRGVLKGAGEDAFASWPVYNKAGKLWIKHVAKPVSEWAHNPDAQERNPVLRFLAKDLKLFADGPRAGGDPNGAMAGKTLLEHAIEWQGKFYLYNVFTNMWRDFYDGTLGAVERWIGGRRNNANHKDEPERHRNLGECLTDGFCNLGRGIIRPFIKQFAPMMVSTPFFWAMGHYGTNMAGGGSGNADTYRGLPGGRPSAARYGEPAHNALDAAGKTFGKALNEFGANVADPLAHGAAAMFGRTPESVGLDGFGRETLDAYARYGTYFATKGWGQEQWAGPAADKAVDKMIDGFFGSVTNTLLPWRWGKIKESGAKFREGVKSYRDILTFRDPETIATAQRYIAAKAEKAGGQGRGAAMAAEQLPAGADEHQPQQARASWLARENDRKKQREASPGMTLGGSHA